MKTKTKAAPVSWHLNGDMVPGETIDPAKLDRDHLLNVALRYVSRFWFLAYSRLMAMRWEWTNATPYGATDGRRLLLNPDGLRKLAGKKNAVGLLAFLLVHEALHAMLGHGWRLAVLRIHKLANIAADYVINLMIHERNKFLAGKGAKGADGGPVFPFIEGVLLDEKLDPKVSAEALYRRLLRDHEEEQPEPPTQPGDEDDSNPEDGDEADEVETPTNDVDVNEDSDSDEDGDDEADQPGEGDDDGTDSDDEGDQPGEGGQPGEGEADEDGEGQGGGEPSDDDSADDSGNGGQGGEPTDEDGDDLADFPGTGAEDLMEPEPEEGETAEEAREDVEERTERVILQDIADSRNRGTGSNGATRFTDHRKREPGLDWRDLLREWMEARCEDGWDRPFNAPVYTSTGLVTAGRGSTTTPEIVCAIDLSGSVGTRTVEQFLREVEAISTDLNPEKIHLLGFCDGIEDDDHAGDNALEPGDEFPTKLKGWGGTSFDPIFQWVEDAQIDPAFVMVLTDGWAPFPEAPEYPVLWLSSEEGPDHYPFGDVIMLPADARRY